MGGHFLKNKKNPSNYLPCALALSGGLAGTKKIKGDFSPNKNKMPRDFHRRQFKKSPFSVLRRFKKNQRVLFTSKLLFLNQTSL